MKKTAVFIVCIFAVILIGCGSESGNTVKSDDGMFSVTFPAGYPKAKRVVQNISTSLGGAKLVMHMSDKSSGSCMVSFRDYGEGLMHVVSAEQILAMIPAPCSIIVGNTALLDKKMPWRLTSTTACHSSKASCAVGLGSPLRSFTAPPALATSTSMRP